MRTDLVMLESEQNGSGRRSSTACSPVRPVAPVRGPRARSGALPPPARLDPAALVDRLRGRNPQLAVEDARIQSAEQGSRAHLPQPLSGLHRRRFADPDGLADRRMGADGRGQHSAAAGDAPRAGVARPSRCSRRPARARKPPCQSADRRTVREPRRARGGAADRDADHDAASCRSPKPTLQSALAGYENGKVDFATLLDAQRQIRKSKQDRLKAQAEAQMRLADDRTTVGRGPMKTGTGLRWSRQPLPWRWASRAAIGGARELRPAASNGVAPLPARAVTAAATSGDADRPARKILYYRNPMGLPDTSPAPKKDPMGMDYIPVYEGEEPAADDGKPGQDQRRQGAEARRAQRTRRAARRWSATVARPLGRIEVDERRVFADRAQVRRLGRAACYVNATGQPVAKGQPLFEVYSPGTRVGAARVRDRRRGASRR